MWIYALSTHAKIAELILTFRGNGKCAAVDFDTSELYSEEKALQVSVMARQTHLVLSHLNNVNTTAITYDNQVHIGLMRRESSCQCDALL